MGNFRRTPGTQVEQGAQGQTTGVATGDPGVTSGVTFGVVPGAELFQIDFRRLGGVEKGTRNREYYAVQYRKGEGSDEHNDRNSRRRNR
jgi:hypothetical protein